MTLNLDGIRLSLSGRPLFAAVTLAVAPGEIGTVMGPSGCGKSSLLAYAAGLLDPAFAAEGRVRLDDADVTAVAAEKRRMGLLYQDPVLFPHMTVAQNLAFALPRGLSRGERRAQVAQALEEAELEGLGDRDPNTLSGGQAMRASLMRTLLSHPRALLLDEPFARLDAPLRSRLRHTVFAAAARRRLPTLLVTHDPADAEAAGGAVIELGHAA